MRGAILLAALALLAPEAGKAGRERWPVKTGGDSGAAAVRLAPVDVTVGQLIALPPPRRCPQATRVSPVETTVYRLTGMVTGCKRETDGDFHLVCADGAGKTLILEIPDPKLLPAGCPWRQQITAARATVAGRLAPVRGKLRACRWAVTITGVGFFDRLHGQDGLAPNGIELHPVLSIGEMLDGR